MSTIEESLKRAYLANGGTESEFESVKGELIVQYRNQATVNAALEEARKPANMNDLMRTMVDDRRDNRVMALLRDPSTQKGSPDAA